MIKSLIKQLPHPLLLRVYHAYYLRQQHSLAVDLARATNLPLLETLNLSPIKTSDTVFILGSGWSINEIPDNRWDVIGRHDTIGFNFWPVHPFVPRIFVFENLCTSIQQDLYRAFFTTIQRRAQDYRLTVKIATEPHPQSRAAALARVTGGLSRESLHRLHRAGYRAQRGRTRGRHRFRSGLKACWSPAITWNGYSNMAALLSRCSASPYE